MPQPEIKSKSNFSLCLHLFIGWDGEASVDITVHRDGLLTASLLGSSVLE